MVTDIAELLMQIADKRAMVDKARRLTALLPAKDAAARSFRSYAEELQAEIEKLEAQAAVLKQAAHQGEKDADPAPAVAALQPLGAPRQEP